MLCLTRSLKVATRIVLLCSGVNWASKSKHTRSICKQIYSCKLLLDFESKHAEQDLAIGNILLHYLVYSSVIFLGNNSVNI